MPHVPVSIPAAANIGLENMSTTQNLPAFNDGIVISDPVELNYYTQSLFHQATIHLMKDNQKVAANFVRVNNSCIEIQHSLRDNSPRRLILEQSNRVFIIDCAVVGRTPWSTELVKLEKIYVTKGLVRRNDRLTPSERTITLKSCFRVVDIERLNYKPSKARNILLSRYANILQYIYPNSACQIQLNIPGRNTNRMQTLSTLRKPLFFSRERKIESETKAMFLSTEQIKDIWSSESYPDSPAGEICIPLMMQNVLCLGYLLIRSKFRRYQALDFTNALRIAKSIQENLGELYRKDLNEIQAELSDISSAGFAMRLLPEQNLNFRPLMGEKIALRIKYLNCSMTDIAAEVNSIHLSSLGLRLGLLLEKSPENGQKLINKLLFYTAA